MASTIDPLGPRLPIKHSQKDNFPQTCGVAGIPAEGWVGCAWLVSTRTRSGVCKNIFGINLVSHLSIWDEFATNLKWVFNDLPLPFPQPWPGGMLTRSTACWTLDVSSCNILPGPRFSSPEIRGFRFKGPGSFPNLGGFQPLLISPALPRILPGRRQNTTRRLSGVIFPIFHRHQKSSKFRIRPKHPKNSKYKKVDPQIDQVVPKIISFHFYGNFVRP